jgi:hypothetical protein
MKMHWCTAKINLAGQGFTVVVLDASQPVSWPEAQVLLALHGGEENVFDIKPCGIADVSPTDEKRRLLGKYGAVVERVFPGRAFRMEMLMPGEGTDQERIYDGEGLIDADASRAAAGNGNGHPQPGPQQPPKPVPDDEDDDEDAAVRSAPAVFKPGKHQPPHKGT